MPPMIKPTHKQEDCCSVASWESVGIFIIS